MEARIIILTQASAQEVRDVLESLFPPQPEVDLVALANRANRDAEKLGQTATALKEVGK